MENYPQIGENVMGRPYGYACANRLIRCAESSHPTV